MKRTSNLKRLGRKTVVQVCAGVCRYQICIPNISKIGQNTRPVGGVKDADHHCRLNLGIRWIDNKKYTHPPNFRNLNEFIQPLRLKNDNIICDNLCKKYIETFRDRQWLMWRP